MTSRPISGRTVFRLRDSLSNADPNPKPSPSREEGSLPAGALAQAGGEGGWIDFNLYKYKEFLTASSLFRLLCNRGRPLPPGAGLLVYIPLNRKVW